MYLLRQFCWNRVEIFLLYTGDTDARKRWTRILKIEFCDFWDFFKFSKRRRAFPLRPIWTIMVAAKLYQSGLLVTKFRQNRLKFKGRSAGQRHTHRQTDRQTNSAENKGPSGLQSGQQTYRRAWPQYISRRLRLTRNVTRHTASTEHSLTFRCRTICCRIASWRRACWLVGWSLMSLFSTNTAISETKASL